MLFTAKVGSTMTDMVGAGAKSGVFTTLNRVTGALVWKTQVGPGGITGGLQWGSATDGKRIYVAESNTSFTYAPGWWAALDPSDGHVIWKTNDPGAPEGATPCNFFPGCTWAAIGFGFGYSAQGPVSTANGVVYACSLNFLGPNMVAMDATTGAIRWSYSSGSSCLGGAAIANGTVYWGTGYRTFAPFTVGVQSGATSLYAFTPGGK
jgi:polyvinyl alcohol dehydrogenase (cytochrome)